MSDLTPEIVEAALSIRGPGGISQSRTLTGSDHVIREAAQKWANPDLKAFHKALYEWFHSERPMSSDVEKELIAAALGVTKGTE